MADSKIAKQILEEVLTPAMVKEIWTINYFDAIPFTLQNFDMGAILPAVFYMFRRGHRRGMGYFRQTYSGKATVVVSGKRAAAPSVYDVADVLVTQREWFDGFDNATGRNIFSDLLLCYNIENKKHEPGRDREIQRTYPTHYMSAWLDLPEKVADLRFVPEMLMNLLANQDSGDVIDITRDHKSWFRVGALFNENVLLDIFGIGMPNSRSRQDLIERYDETAAVGVDQILTIRLAQKLHAPPKRLADTSKGSSDISNQRPVAFEAAKLLSEDMRLFLQAFGRSIPRQSLLPMLESCISLGLTNILLSSSKMLFEWSRSGTLPKSQLSWPLFVDCSLSSNRSLRRSAELSMDECTRQLRQLPVILMALRIVGYKARLRLKDELPSARPYPTDRINFLGEIAFDRHRQSNRILEDIEEKCNELAENLHREGMSDEATSVLENTSVPGLWRLAEAITMLMSDEIQMRHLLKALRSCLMVGESNGLAIERRAILQQSTTGRKSSIVSSIVLTNTMLDFLVHRHLHKPGKKGYTRERPLSYADFLGILRERYGLYVDQAPPSQSMSTELLLDNRRILESRLRDLGLLVGVNDAESMKFLHSRFFANSASSNTDSHLDTTR